MAEVSEQEHFSKTGDDNLNLYLSMDQFLRNMPRELEILHHARDSLHRNIYAVFHQKENHQPTFDSYETSSQVKHKIESALIEFRSRLSTSLSYLVQFWAPVSINGRRHLITSELPFSIYNVVDEGICSGCSYRKRCMDYHYSADLVDGYSLLGPPGRVFVSGTAEFNKITDYSNHEYSFKDYALTCQGDDILFVPLYESHGGQCIGVVEYIVFGNCQFLIEDVFQDMSAVFQSANLILKEWPCSFSGVSDALIELDEALKYVCQEECIPFAQVWRPSRDVLTNSIVYSVIQQKWHKRIDTGNYSFYTECEKLRSNQRVVGQAFSSFTSCFCGNLTQLITGVYPDASIVDLLSSFAVCLRHGSSGYRTFILEFFFSNFATTFGDPLKLVRYVLDIIKHKFPNLRQASGQELGADIQFLFPFPNDVVYVSPHDSPTNNAYPPVKTTLAEVSSLADFTPSRGEALRSSSEQLEPVVVEADMMQSGQPSIGNDLDILQIIDPSEAEMIMSNQHSVPNSHNMDRLQKGSDDIFPFDNGQAVDEFEMEVRITRQVIEQHAVSKLELVARHLQVSTSTFKRICRKYGIKNWISFRKATVKRMHPDSLKAAEEHIKHRYCRTGDQCLSISNDNISSVESVESIRKKPRIQNANNVTVKASYEGDMKRLEFNLMTKIADLVQELGKSFCLQSDNFKIKYEDEDGDWILLETDNDLTDCFTNVKSFRNKIVYVNIEKICNVSS